MELPTVQIAPGGCEQCDSTGYRGRVGIYEILLFNDAIRYATRSGNQNDEIRALARHNGMKFMQEQGLELVRDGITPLEELQRVAPFAQLTPKTVLPAAAMYRRPFLFAPTAALNGSEASGRLRPKESRRPSEDECEKESGHHTNTSISRRASRPQCPRNRPFLRRTKRADSSPPS